MYYHIWAHFHVQAVCGGNKTRPFSVLLSATGKVMTAGNHSEGKMEIGVIHENIGLNKIRKLFSSQHHKSLACLVKTSNNSDHNY